jgi:hypothetical protein
MTPYWIVAALSTGAQFVLFVRWLHRRTRDDEIRRAFVRDMALNHLPHLYHALRQIAAHLGIELDDPPPVRFLEINGPAHK